MLWFDKLMVRFFMSLDTVLFNFIATLYDLLIAISRTSILTQGDIASFVTRIEILLGIFMLFKVSFSLITYVVNPDDFSDKSKGFGKLIQNSVISLVLLVLVPYIFQMAFNLQAKILDDNVLAKLLLGEKINDSTDSNATIIDTAGNQMAFYVMLPFFSPNYAVEGLSACMTMVDENGFSGECRTALKEAGLKDSDLDNYTHGIENKSLGLTFRANTAITLTNEAKDEGDKAEQHFVIAYQKPLSTVTAVVVCLLLISFCIDIGVRSVKLAFLQLIYPIPVISYMDPKSGKDGMFSKWYKMCLSTFLSLFIRLLALYFGIYIITKVADFGMYDIINGSQITNGWVKIFVIIGVLMFIKQLPKILENMGIKIDGDGKFSLNPLKKIEEGAAGGKMLKKAAIGIGAGGLAGAAAFGSNLLTAGSRIRNAEGLRGKLRAGLNTFTGGFSAMRRGATSGLKGEKLGKSFSNSYSGAMEAMKREQERADDNVGKMGVRMAKAQKAMGMQTAGDRVKKEQERLKKINENFKKIKDTAIATDKEAKDWNKKIDTIKKSAPTVDKYQDANGNWLDGSANGDAYNAAVKSYNKVLKNAEDELDKRINELAKGAARVYSLDDNGQRVYNDGANAAIASLAADMTDTVPKANKLGHRVDSDYADITETAATNAKVSAGQAVGAQTQVSASAQAQHALDVDRYAESKKN